MRLLASAVRAGEAIVGGLWDFAVLYKYLPFVRFSVHSRALRIVRDTKAGFGATAESFEPNAALEKFSYRRVLHPSTLPMTFLAASCY